MNFRTGCFRKFDYGVALLVDRSGSYRQVVVIIMKSLISVPAFIYVNSTYLLHLPLNQLTIPSRPISIEHSLTFTSNTLFLLPKPSTFFYFFPSFPPNQIIISHRPSRNPFLLRREKEGDGLRVEEEIETIFKDGGGQERCGSECWWWE